jgi:hypothetical protein
VGSDGFRSEFAQLVRDLLDESYREAHTPIREPLREHLRGDVDDLAVHGESLENYDLPNLQLAFDAALARPGFSARIVGVAGQGRRFSDVSLSDLLTTTHLGVGAPEYVNVAAGPEETLPCLTWGVLLVTAPEGPVCVFVRQGEEHGPTPGVVVQAVAHDPELARCFLADVRTLMDEHDVFRNQVITIESDRRGRNRVVFLERRRWRKASSSCPRACSTASSATSSARPGTASRCSR